jgi:hypothetical protein
MDEQALSRLHYELVHGLVEQGACPTNAELSKTLGLSESEVEGQLRELAAIHGVVLHPHVCAPWVIHPFSTTPTLNWVAGDRGSWWAPCVWCAIGVAVVVGGRTTIHTRFGAESEPLVIDLEDGRLVRGEGIWVHFAIPPAHAWDNVHQHCSMVLPFRTTADIEKWCGRHGVRMGQAVRLTQVAKLARAWYGSHSSPEWKKWSVADAQEIFTQVGLTSDFWKLEAKEGKF